MLFHPIEMVIQVLLQLFVSVIVLGLDLLAAALTGYVAAFYGMFQHWNVRTPQWLGVLIQRPEAHCEHHRKGVHANSYGDLPIWDMLLGSFRNPKTFDGECGFETPADRQVLAMLALRDVNEPVYGGKSRGFSPQASGARGTPSAARCRNAARLRRQSQSRVRGAGRPPAVPGSSGYSAPCPKRRTAPPRCR